MRALKLLPLFIAAIALLLSGCDTESSKDGKVNELFNELMKLPDIRTVESQYQGLLTQLQERLHAEMGLKPWDPAREPVSASACVGELSSLSSDGEIRRLSPGSSPGNISDADWPRAVKLVSDVAKQQGFGEPEVVVERPGDHEVSFRDNYGARLIFGTAKNTILGISTGCHLTREAHERGAPAPEKPLY